MTKTSTTDSVQVEEWGSTGPRVICVHGSISFGAAAFESQKPLSERHRLVVVYRRGYGSSPATDRVDPDVDATDVLELLQDGAHLVGTSMGGIVAMKAAAQRPDGVKSLTVIEPPAFGVARDDTTVAESAQRLETFYAQAPQDPEQWLQGFLDALGFVMPLPSPLPPPVVQATRNAMTERPWALDAPVEELAAASFPKLVVSGEGSPAFEVIADRLAAAIDAQRHRFPGVGHAAQKAPGFNELLEEVIEQGEQR
jgi:pimeloyl-ACP methyl ester carboxylesterase